MLLQFLCKLLEEGKKRAEGLEGGGHNPAWLALLEIGDVVNQLVGCLEGAGGHALQNHARLQLRAQIKQVGEGVGNRLDADGDALGFMTDTGIVTGDAFEALQACRVLALESNHDVDMLEHGPYPRYLKDRVASERGHLSNAQSAELLERLLCNELEQVIGMHVSQNNNTYALPPDVLKATLSRYDHPALATVGYQDRVMSV